MTTLEGFLEWPMSGDVMNIKETQSPDSKHYFNPPPLPRGDTDDALRSRLAEMGVSHGSYTFSASHSQENVQAQSPDLRFIVQGGIDNAAPMATVFNGLARAVASRFL